MQEHLCLPHFILEKNDSYVPIVVAQLLIVVRVNVDAVHRGRQGALLVPVLKIVPAQKHQHLVGRVALIEHLKAVRRADDHTRRDERASTLKVQ